MSENLWLISFSIDVVALQILDMVEFFNYRKCQTRTDFP